MITVRRTTPNNTQPRVRFVRSHPDKPEARMHSQPATFSSTMKPSRKPRKNLMISGTSLGGVKVLEP